MKQIIGFTLILFIGFSSCSKEGKSCRLHKKKPMEISAPDVVYERSDLSLSVKNVHDLGVNADYGWWFPDMSMYSILGGYGLDVDIQDKNWTIHDVRVQDQGNYTFTAGDNGCGTFKAQKFIEVKELPTPCFNDIANNTMYVRDSATNTEETINCVGDVYDTEGDLKLDIEGPMFTYRINVVFDFLPERNSTFYLRNVYQDFDESSLEDDEQIQAHVAFIPSTAGYNEFKVKPDTEDMHFKRDGNQITLTLCNVRFKSNNEVKYVTAKVVFTI